MGQLPTKHCSFDKNCTQKWMTPKKDVTKKIRKQGAPLKKIMKEEKNWVPFWKAGPKTGLSLKCLCTEILPPPPQKTCTEILPPPLNLPALNFLAPLFAVFQIMPILPPEANKNVCGQTDMGSSPPCRTGLFH